MYKQFLKNASNYLSELQSPRLQLQAHQPTRRTALKLMVGSGAGVAMPFAATAATQSSPRPSPRLLHQSDVGHFMAKLQVEIITGTSTPEDTVLLSTTADHPVLLKRFMPGTLVVGDRTLDLNQALVSDALEVAPGTEKSVLLPSFLTSWRHQSDRALQEYLVVDSAVEVLSDAYNAGDDAVPDEASASTAVMASTQIITLHALVDADGTAILYVPSTEVAVGLV